MRVILSRIIILGTGRETLSERIIIFIICRRQAGSQMIFTVTGCLDFLNARSTMVSMRSSSFW